jgi:hypothetical protein
MPRKISMYVLLIVIVGVLLNHFSFSQKENGWLLNVDGREVDAIGMAQEKWVQLTRNCSQVKQLDSKSESYLAVQKLIQEYSPPSSESAHIVKLVTLQDWYLAEVEFKELLPAVVLMDTDQGQLRMVPHAIWSGETHPWLAAPFIRKYLSSQAPQSPRQLLACFDPL